ERERGLGRLRALGLSRRLRPRPLGLAQAREARQAVVRDRLPRHGEVDEHPVLRADAGIAVERPQADRHLLVGERVAAEGGRAALGAEQLASAAFGRAVALQLLLA